MGKSARVRQRLFDIGAQALRTHLGEESMGGYGCPLCCRLFLPKALADGYLTLEHIPPGSIGGRRVMLTCRSCNNTAGHTVDADAVRGHRSTELVDALYHDTGTTSGTGHLIVHGQRLNVEYVATGKRLTFSPRGRPPAPQAPHHDAYHEVWPNERPPNARKRDLHFTPDLGHQRSLARVGDLRTAYLAAFATFGYAYALHPWLEPVRRQLQDPGTEHITGYAFDLDDRKSSAGQELGLFHDPVPCLAVRIRRRGIVLPWLEGAGWDYPFPMMDTPSPHPADEGRPRVHLTGGEEFPWPTTMRMLLDSPASASRNRQFAIRVMSQTDDVTEPAERAGMFPAAEDHGSADTPDGLGAVAPA